MPSASFLSENVIRKTLPTATQRPSLRLIAHFCTSGPVHVVQDWLKQNCREDWVIRSEGASDDLRTKNYLVSFESRDDRDAFRKRFTKHA